MTDPAGSDRIQQDVPTASGTGDNADTGASAEGVPPSREEAIERDAATGGDQSARTSGQPELADRAENSLDS